MKLIKHVKFFRLTSVCHNNKNYGLCFYLNQTAVDEYLKENPETQDETIEVDGVFQEPNYIKGPDTSNVPPFGPKTELRGNYISNLKVDRYGNSAPKSILEKFGKATLTVQLRYNKAGYLNAIFVGTKRAFIKNVVNRQSWVDATIEDLVAIKETWPDLFKHFFPV
ncbi:hypothetical protein [Aeromonas phage ZPAH34]|uniref:hypothetical protein n=1 Tax=Aeromonas phage ZPAH34 TaxID=2924888 RepID=UPI0023299BA2|nr:hypothetical protein PQD16_gp151 [Aeromonas phage ZPAH34]UOX39532.1 hypothetical protein [Aeromonas phage ZPAH34]